MESENKNLKKELDGGRKLVFNCIITLIVNRINLHDPVAPKCNRPIKVLIKVKWRLKIIN